MSLRAVGFVENWLSRNGSAKSSVGNCSREESQYYAVHLLIAANASGISPEEINTEFPDLIGVIAGTLAGVPLTLGDHWRTDARAHTAP